MTIQDRKITLVCIVAAWFGSLALIAAAQVVPDTSPLDSGNERPAHAYRVSWDVLMPNRSGAVRLDVGPDGSATISALVTRYVRKEGAEKLGRVIGRDDDGFVRIVVTEKSANVDKADVDKFLELIKKSGFWSMPSKEVSKPNRPLDGMGYSVEGIRNGIFHRVSRNNPEQGAYTELVRCLAKDIAKLEDSVGYIAAAR